MDNVDLDSFSLTQHTLNRLGFLQLHGETIDRLVNRLCEYAENTPYDFFNLPVQSRPRRRQLGCIDIGASSQYSVPAVDKDNFVSSVHSYGSRYGMRFKIDWLPEYHAVHTVTVTRIA